MSVKIGQYTTTAARYSNPNNTAAILTTAEAGEIAVFKLETPDLWDALMSSGLTVAANPGPSIVEQIGILEAKVTPRRLREAALGTDNGWLDGINDQIEALRAQL